MGFSALRSPVAPPARVRCSPSRGPQAQFPERTGGAERVRQKRYEAKQFLLVRALSLHSNDWGKFVRTFALFTTNCQREQALISSASVCFMDWDKRSSRTSRKVEELASTCHPLKATKTKEQAGILPFLPANQTVLKPADCLRYLETRPPCSAQALPHC